MPAVETCDNQVTSRVSGDLMRHITALLTIAVLALTSACGSDEAGGGTAIVGDQGLDVCGLVSDETVADLQEGFGDKPVAPAETLKSGAELFVECRVVPSPAVGFAVRAAMGGPALTALSAGTGVSSGVAAEPLAGIGDEAMISTNSYDGVRIVARVGDQDLIVDSNVYDNGDSDTITRDDVVALAKEVAANLGDEKPGAVRLPKACPSATGSTVQEAVGTVLVARGSAASNGSLTCTYVSEQRTATLASVVGNQGMSVMAQADSPPENRIEVDGEPALYDDSDGVAVFVGDECVIGASASPVGWALADQRPESEQKAEDVALATFVKKEIGCP